MEYDEKKVALEFYNRTFKLIEQYETLKEQLPPDEQYEVTLLINCLFGALIMPKAKWYQELSNIKIEDLKSEFASNGITLNNIKNLDFEGFIRGLRNGLSHWFEVRERKDHSNNISFINSDYKINKIILQGCAPKIQDFSVEFENSSSLFSFLKILKKALFQKQSK